MLHVEHSRHSGFLSPGSQQRPRQKLEFRHAQRFRPALGRNTGLGQQRLATDPAQGAAQHFPALPERGGGQALHRGEKGLIRLHRLRHQPDHGGSDFRRRVKAAAGTCIMIAASQIHWLSTESRP